jgi:serine/threonine-protein kinase
LSLAAETTADDLGGMLGRYELCAEIARGGMARVFLARATGPGGFEKLSALKLVHAKFAADRDFIEMFLDEAKIASRIEHPNVCAVFDFGHAAGSYYLAMEYLTGEPVSRILARLAEADDPLSDPRTPLRIARLIADAAEGLHAAHELKNPDGTLVHVVHRDVSPHNLFVTYAGAVKVVDFGIASAVGKVHKTRSGVIRGKVAYMSPEQLRGDDVDRRTDVWALGVTLWELCTRRRLFRKPNHGATIEAVLNEPIPSPRELAAEIPPEIAAVVMRALERERERRYDTARDMARDLNAYIARSGRHVGMPELAEWMAELFPGERARRDLLVRDATEGKISIKTAAPEEPERVTGPLTVPALPRTDTVILPTYRGRWVFVALALVVLFVAAGSIAVYALGGDAEPIARESAPTEERAPPVAPVEPAMTEAPPEPDAIEPSVATEEPAMEIAREVDRGSARRATSEARVRSMNDEPRVETAQEQPVQARAPGHVDIATPNGWAEVYVGGRAYGRTPIRITLPAGRAVIELRPNGTGTPIRVPVDVPSGAGTRVSRPLPRD